MWDLPGPGLEPVSPALAGGFLTAAPPGKLMSLFFFETLAPSRGSMNICWIEWNGLELHFKEEMEYPICM